jgi:hypothetical protein
MVSMANRKLAETEEELRIATEQKEALRGALRIVEGENGALRGTAVERDVDEGRDQCDARDVVVDENNMDGVGSHDDIQTVQEPSKSRPRPPPIPTHSLPSSHPHVRPIPVSDSRPGTSSKLKSFWSPVTPQSGFGGRMDGELPTTASESPSTPSQMLSPTPQLLATPGLQTDGQGSVHRWSMLPESPRARNAVRGEFEDALRRMREIVEDSGDDDAKSVIAVTEVKKQEGEGIGISDSEADRHLGESKRNDAEAGRGKGGVNPWRT